MIKKNVLLLVLCFMALPAFADRPKAPYKILYSNDTTQIFTCKHPEIPNGWRLEERLIKSINETANTGVEVHLLQPGLGWVPWWQSEFYPMDRHLKWWENYYKNKPHIGSYVRYVRDGGDLIEVFLEQCKKDDLIAFVSLRLNDVHVLAAADDPKNRGTGGVSRFYAEHPEYRIGPEKNSSQGGWIKYLQNWAIPQVRNYKYQILKEICLNYDIDGLELDFMRAAGYFRQNETTIAQRKKIMTGFIKKVRQALDRGAKPGQYRWLCVRIPNNPDNCDRIGIDPKMIYDAGVDMFVSSGCYYIQQQNGIRNLRKLVPKASIYEEIHYVTSTIRTKDKTKYGEKVSYGRRYATKNMLYTTSYLTLTKGAEGISAFNFPYYRFLDKEPPFDVFQKLTNYEFLSTQPQHYVYTDGWQPGAIKLLTSQSKLSKTKALSITMEFARPKQGWQKTGKLRAMFRKGAGKDNITASINGTVLTETSDISEPYQSPYETTGPLVCTQANTKAWLVPAGILDHGDNKIDFQVVSGEENTCNYIDLAMP